MERDTTQAPPGTALTTLTLHVHGGPASLSRSSHPWSRCALIVCAWRSLVSLMNTHFVWEQERCIEQYISKDAHAALFLFTRHTQAVVSNHHTQHEAPPAAVQSTISRVPVMADSGVLVFTISLRSVFFYHSLTHQGQGQLSMTGTAKHKTCNPYFFTHAFHKPQGCHSTALLACPCVSMEQLCPPKAQMAATWFLRG